MSKPTAGTTPPIVKPEVALIEDLFDEMAAGRIRVPRFQRPFIWRPEDMRALFDSIEKGYPIGSLLLWSTTESVDSLPELGPIRIPAHEANPAAFILDGQQRLLTLYGALRLPKATLRDGDPDNWRWWLWYDLRNSEFVHVPGGREPDAHLFRLRDLLKTTDFLAAAREIERSIPTESDELIERAEGLAQKLKSYKVAVIRIHGGTVDQAVEIFSRLNSKGRAMTPDQMVSALTYPQKQGAVNLAGRIDEILEKLSEYSLDELDRNAVFRAIVAAADEDPFRSDWSALAKRLGPHLTKTIDSATDAMLRAAAFAHDRLRVPGDHMLPYSLQLVMLSEFFRKRKSPSKDQLNALERWFWSTTFSGWFAGANSTQINDGVNDLREFAKGSTGALSSMWDASPMRPYPKTFDLRSARLRALLLVLLRSLRPLDCEGKPFDAYQLLREHRHRAYLYATKIRAGDLASNPANRILLPPLHGKSVRTRLLEMPTAVRSAVLDSHGIPADALAALERNEDDAFIELRAQRLEAIERKFMSKIGLEPPTLQAGESTDNE